MTFIDARVLVSRLYSSVEAARFMAKFPGLKKISHSELFFGNFEEWLLVLKNNPTYPDVKIAFDDSDNFMETHMSSLSDIDRRALVERLSQVSHLKCKYDTLPVNAMMIGSKYLTGLSTFVLNIFVCDNWNQLQKQTFTTDVLNLLTTVQKWGLVCLQQMEYTFFSASFADIVRKVFDGLPTTNYFRLTVHREYGTQKLIDVLLRYQNER